MEIVKIKEEIIRLVDELEYSLVKEIHKNKEEKESLLKESLEFTNLIYDKITYENAEKVIKSKLPLTIKLFNKIHCIGYRISSPGWIKLDFQFNRNMKDIVSLNVTSKEISDILKLNIDNI